MTLKEFAQLAQNEKIDLLHRQGTYIGKRKLATATVLLFQLDGFYAEVFYREYRRVIQCIRLFADTDKLEPYLPQVYVEQLV